MCWAWLHSRHRYLQWQRSATVRRSTTVEKMRVNTDEAGLTRSFQPNEDLNEFSFLFFVPVNVSSGLSPEIPCDKAASGTVGRSAAHLGLLDEVHKYRHGSLIILSHRRSGDTLYSVTPWKSPGSRLGTLALNLRCDILCVFVTKCLGPRQALLAFIQSALVRHVYGL